MEQKSYLLDAVVRWLHPKLWAWSSAITVLTGALGTSDALGLRTTALSEVEDLV